MSLRIFSALASLGLLAACAGESPPPPGETIECAIGAGAELSPVCTLERVAGTRALVLHHPDGGFRRVDRDPSTNTLTVLDGADPLVSQPSDGDAIAFAIGADRYRVPLALLKPGSP
jgi:hypothetical protein